VVVGGCGCVRVRLVGLVVVAVMVMAEGGSVVLCTYWWSWGEVAPDCSECLLLFESLLVFCGVG
jgi:hypothetical protein